MKLFEEVTPCKAVCSVCGQITEVEDSNRRIWRFINKDHKNREVIVTGLKCHHNFCQVSVLDKNGLPIERINKQKLGAWRYYTLKGYDSILDFRDSLIELAWKIHQILFWWTIGIG